MPFVKSHKDSELLEIGHTAYRQKKFSLSIKKMQEVIKTTDDPTTKAYAEYYLAYIYLRDIIAPDKCYEMALRALGNFEKGNFESPRFYSRTLDILGDYHNRAGNLDSAEYYYHRRYRFAKKNKEPNYTISSALSGLANNLYQKREYLFGGEIQLPIINFDSTKQHTSNYISFLFHKGDFSKMLTNIEEMSKKPLENINSNTYLYFLALYHIENNAYKKAISVLDKFIKITLATRQKYHSEINTDTYLLTHFYIAKAYWQKAYCYKDLGEIDKGISNLKLALKHINISMEAQAQRNLVLQSRIYRSLDEFYWESKQKPKNDYLAKSFEVINTYLQHKSDTNSVIHYELMHNYFIKATRLHHENEKDQSYWQSYIHLKKFVSKQYYDEDQLQHLSSLKSLQEQLIQYFANRFIATQKEDYLFNTLEITENAKSYILYKRNKTGQHISVEEYLEQKNIFQLKKAQKDSPLLSPNAIRCYFKKYYAEQGKSFLSYYLLENKLLIISLSEDHYELHLRHLTNKDIALIGQIGEQLQASDFFIERSFIDQLAQLRMLLLPQTMLETHEESIVVSSHDKLAGIPLEVLPLGENRRYLLEDHAISYAFSLHHDLLMKESNSALTDDQLSILGIAPFASKDLPFSAQEVRNISDDFMIDEQATREEVLKSYTDYEILHFATHANFDDKQNSAEIYLYAEGAEKTGLRFEEIENLDFSNHKLIALSACYTGTGNYMEGEGMMSLQRAFAYSKAPSILASLWKVEDQASTFILKEFYNEIKKGSPKDQALRTAKLKYIEAYPVARMNPMFWGGMIISGNMGEVVAPHSFASRIAFFVLLLGFFLLFYFRKKRQQRQNITRVPN